MKRKKEGMVCPVGLSEVLIAVFLVEMSQIDTENETKLFPNFQCFYAFSVEVSTDFVDWNVLMSQQGKKLVVQ